MCEDYQDLQNENIEKPHGEFVQFFSTCQTFEFDIVCDILTEAEIPYITYMETVSGMRLAMSVMPVGGMGEIYYISVEKTYYEAATELVDDLGVVDRSKNPEPWSAISDEKDPVNWKAYLAFTLITGLIIMIYTIYSSLSN